MPLYVRLYLKMDLKSKYQIYDDILQTLYNESNHCLLTSKIAEKLDVEFRVVHSLTLELVELGYINNKDSKGKIMEILSRGHDLRGDFFATLVQKGKFFLKDEGGFKEKYKDLKTKKSWTNAKTAVVVVNAIIVLWLSWMTFNESRKSNKLEEELSSAKKVELELRQEIKKKDSTIKKIRGK